MTFREVRHCVKCGAIEDMDKDMAESLETKQTETRLEQLARAVTAARIAKERLNKIRERAKTQREPDMSGFASLHESLGEVFEPIQEQDFVRKTTPTPHELDRRLDTLEVMMVNMCEMLKKLLANS